MTALKGTRVASPVVPFDSNDKYPVADINYVCGGSHIVNTVAERNSIPAERRKAGMLVFVVDKNKHFKLKVGYTHATDPTTVDGDWEEFKTNSDGLEVADKNALEKIAEADRTAGMVVYVKNEDKYYKLKGLPTGATTVAAKDWYEFGEVCKHTNIVNTVKDTAALKAIPEADRTAGMIVYVKDENAYYKLVGTPTGATTTDDDWELFGDLAKAAVTVKTKNDLTALDIKDLTVGQLVYVTGEKVYYKLNNVPATGNTTLDDWSLFGEQTPNEIVEVADKTARNALVKAKRKKGMLVYAVAEDKYYKLIGEPSTSTTTDDDWEVFGELAKDEIAKVDTLADRNNIAKADRSAGMLVYVGADNKYYKLIGVPAGATTTADDWEVFGDPGTDEITKVADTTALKAIAEKNRTKGMLVYVTAEDKYFKLIGAPTGATTTDDDWKLFGDTTDEITKVADTTARNNIVLADRTKGMLVYVTAEDKYFKLIGAPSTATTVDNDWEVFGEGKTELTQVADTTALKAIVEEDRTKGMLVYVVSDDAYYKLVGSPTGAATTDDDWAKMQFGAPDVPQHLQFVISPPAVGSSACEYMTMYNSVIEEIAFGVPIDSTVTQDIAFELETCPANGTSYSSLAGASWTLSASDTDKFTRSNILSQDITIPNDSRLRVKITGVNASDDIKALMVRVTIKKKTV